MYSFSIFETLISQNVLNHMQIYELMQKEMLERCSEKGFSYYFVDNFAAYRINAEKEAYDWASRNGKEEIIIEDIYSVLGFMHNLQDSQIQWLIQCEFEKEYLFSYGIKENIDLLKKIKEESNVYLIEDTYLPKILIKKILYKVDEALVDIPILLSNECVCSKKSGTIYDYFIKTNQINVEDWIHIGSNELEDFINVKKYGGNVIRTKNNFFSLGELVSPILFSYVCWVLQQAQNSNITDLYFVARDGYFLKKIADKIISDKELCLRTHYFYSSRIACRIPSAAYDLNAIKISFLKERSLNTVRNICDYLGIEITFLEKYIGKVFDADEILLDNENEYILSQIMHEEDFWREVLCVAEKKLKNLEGYLRQELKTNENVAFVEINGTGKTQECLQNVALEIGLTKFVNYYYDLSGVEPTEGYIFYKFIPSKGDGSNIIELITRAPHGITKGYTYINNKYAPIVEKNVEGFASKEDYVSYEDGIMNMVEKMLHNPIASNGFKPQTCQKMQSELVYEIMHNYKDVIGEMVFSSGVNNVSKKKYAPKLTSEDICKITQCRYAELWRKSYKGDNIKLSILRSGDKEKKVLDDYFGEEPYFEKILAFPIKGRVVIFGAGNRGTKLYKQYSEMDGVTVVAWVDTHYEDIGNPNVMDPRKLEEIHYDYIHISMADRKIRASIIEELKKKKIQATVIENKSTNDYLLELDSKYK